MNRARASALVLVNFRGVFYERYLLDRNVTSLEGANGAGKTTVMIAAYLVLLPDMSRLRFTNLGETAATGGDRGIWGRLGEPGRPSYAALQLDVGSGEHIVIGVHLERKAEPSVEPKAFVVTGPAASAPLSELFLVKTEREEAIAELQELNGNAARLGGRVDVFRSTKEYFAELFERGVFPLRLASDDDRNKLNEMLRTSMTGGISRALTTELRSFLLREESGLSDALSRMRKNLDTCRRTRGEVLEAQRLERDITGVQQAAHGMLRAALAASRAELSELRIKAEETDRERRRAEAKVAQLERDLEGAAAVQKRVSEALAATRLLVARAHSDLHRADQARELSSRLAGLEAEQQRLVAALAEARGARDEAAATRDRARALRGRAQHSLALAAAGLSRHETGLDELHRRAHAHRVASESLARARSLSGVPELDPKSALEELARVRAELERVDRLRIERTRELETAGIRRAEFESTFHALVSLVADARPSHAFERARLELGRTIELQALAAEIEPLDWEVQESARRSVERRGLIEQARQFDLDLSSAEDAQALMTVWREAEQTAAEQDAQIREEEERSSKAREREQSLLPRLRSLETLAERTAEYQTRLGRLAAVLGEPIPEEAALLRARERLLQRREASRRRLAELAAERDAAVELANRLEAMRGAVPSELLALADELDAELALSRFEDLDPDAASETEAALGPLCDALVVEDPARAARHLAGRARDLSEVWLVDADRLRARTAQAAVTIGADVVVEPEPGIARVARKAENPKLGRRARAMKAEASRERAARLTEEAEATSHAQLSEETALREAERLSIAEDLGRGADVAGELVACRDALAAARHEREHADRRLHEAHAAQRSSRERARGLGALLARSHLLGHPYGARSEEEARRRLEAAREAKTQLERGASAREVLARSMESLRVPPPTVEELGRFERERAELETERDRSFAIVEALEALARHAEALGFEDAERALAAQTAIAPALQAQHDLSVRELSAAEEAVERSDQVWEAKTRAAQAVEAEQLASEAVIARAREELAALSALLDPRTAVATTRDHARALEGRMETLSSEERAASAEFVLLRDRLERAKATLSQLELETERARGAAAPLETSWRDVRERAEAEGASCAGLDELEVLLRTSSELSAEARGKRELLLERLERARGGTEVARALRDGESDPSESSVQARLREWLVVRDFLGRCLPAQVASASDPVAAIEALGRNLVLLEERLTRQELDLRGTSEDVARSIDVQVRRAQSQVRRLNQHLSGVRFGSINAIRIRIARIERMDQVLKALREGATQELLFQPGIPIEEALNEIFRRYAGGKSGGQRLLDYREYLEVGVEVARRNDQEFEPANPTRLSTGEAIGVGAALMMMVLTEWERDANLLRGKRDIGSLRFLFLDEANRLSQDNLAVLFDLCQSLDLQLLIAAPEVARAEGNTTYRLVRRTDESGKDEVIVSGRRGLSATERAASRPAMPSFVDGELEPNP
jgi:chromosome partition protein MukB